MKICIKNKYRIAYIMHKGDTLGGFPQHVEHSIYGLKKLGHEVDFYLLAHISSSNEKNINEKIEKYNKGQLVIDGKKISKLDIGIGTGLYFHSFIGWFTPVTTFKSYEDKLKLKDKLETYDVVFWHTPFWFKQKSIQKDIDWPLLLDLKNPVNIAFHHDANIRSNSAWMHFIDKYFDRIITVHPASYNACKVLETPRCMIFNPQIINYDENYTGYSNFKKGIIQYFSLQYWKSSKHVDDLIRAIPHFYNEFTKAKFVIGGKGLEFHYMHSKEKIKKEYLCNDKNDPDIDKKNIGKPIVEVAKKYGLTTPLWLSEQERNLQFKKSMFFVDTAYYSISKEYGEHFSRTLIESMINGVVPIAINLGLSNNESGEGDIFKPNINYLMIPWDSTPKQFANKLIDFLLIDECDYNSIVKNNYKLLKHFDVINVCRQYIDVIQGKNTGWYKKYEIGEPTKAFIKKAEKQWYGDGEKRSFNFKK